MKISLNGAWRFKVDSNNRGMKERWSNVSWIMKHYNSLNEMGLPNNWNIIPTLDKYEGIVWFFLKLDFKEDIIDLIDKNEVFIQFMAVNYHTHLWINGVDCGIHEGNFIPFKFRVRSGILRAKEDNYIALYVENFRRKNRIPTKSRDWFNWGGVYRDINFLLLKKNRINWAGVRTKIYNRSETEIQVNFKLNFISSLEIKDWEIQWELFLVGNVSSKNKHTASPIIKNSAKFIPIISRKMQSFSFKVKDPRLWSVKDPNLYLLKLYFPKTSIPYEIRFGIREIKFLGSKLLLNGKEIFLKGINLHEELVPNGRVIPKENQLNDVLNIKTLGFNALRTGHYPHDESIYDICDEEGLIVLEEIPVYWGINFSNSEVLKLALYLLRTMVYRDFNHPSIIMWSVGNEIQLSNKACRYFIRELLKYARELDDSRLITCVLEVWMSLIASKDIIREFDVLCINQYIGWYYFSVNNLNIFLDCLNMLHRKPIFVTEFGAGAQYGYHDYSELPRKYTEERQVSIVEHSIKVMNSKQYIKGWFIWIYRDFRSHMRLNKYQKGYNRKGIVDQSNNPKMIAERMPFIVNKVINNIKHHKVRAFIFYITLFPLIKLVALIISTILGKFSNSGDDYYLSREID